MDKHSTKIRYATLNTKNMNKRARCISIVVELFASVFVVPFDFHFPLNVLKK